MLLPGLIGITDLVAVNLQCFGMITLGYLSRRSSLLGPEEAKGLNIFVSYFSLPAMIFQSLATMHLANIDFNFVGSILLSKSIIFALVLLVTYLLSATSPTANRYQITRRSAIYSMFCTQSNDFALGYPLLLSLYGNASDSLANYLYILAPIQLMLLNPAALLMIEVSKNLEEEGRSSAYVGHRRPSLCRRAAVLGKTVLQKVFINPIILATALGLAVNLLNGERLPPVTAPFFAVLAQSFSSVALFLLGLNLHGNSRLLSSFSQPLLITLLLVALKIFFMPLVNRFCVQHVRFFPSQLAENNTTSTMAEFAFLYGTFPAAPTVYIFSHLYGVETVIVSSGLVISTLFSAPLMFVSANMIRLSSLIDYRLLGEDLLETAFFTGVISTVGSLLLVYSFVSKYKMRSLTHCYTFKILLSHLLVLAGGFLYKLNTADKFSVGSRLSMVQYLLIHCGLFSLKLWTVCLSLILVLLYARSLCYSVKVASRLLVIGLVAILAYAVFLFSTYRVTPLLLPSSGAAQAKLTPLDLYFGVNRLHMFCSMFASCLSILTMIVSLALLHRYKSRIEYLSLMDEANENGSSSAVASGSSGSSAASTSSAAQDDDDNDQQVLIIEQQRQHQPSGKQPLQAPLPPPRRQRTSNSATIEVEDLFLSLPRNRLTSLSGGGVGGDDFKDTCHDVCTNCSSSGAGRTAAARAGTGVAGAAAKEGGAYSDRLRVYKMNIESAIEAVELFSGGGGPLSAAEVGSSGSYDEGFHQVFHHMYLLLFLALATVVHLVVEVYHYAGEDEATAIAVEVQFLDILLTFSGGLVMFIIFGFDIGPLLRRLSKACKLSLRLNQIYLPPVGELEVETVEICEQFRERHLKATIEAIGFQLDSIEPPNAAAGEEQMQQPHSNYVFSGRRLIDWLIRKRLVANRQEGLDLGRHLLYGRVLEHITREHFFCDNTFYYRFIV